MEANKWLFFFLMVVMCWYSYRGKSNGIKRDCVCTVTVILTCFSGFRSWQMGDVFHYCYAYVAVNSPGWKLQMAGQGDTVGLQLFYWVAGQLGISFEICLLIIAAFVAISLGMLVYKYSPSPFWSYVIYLAMGFYIFTLSGLKQAIAMGFIMYAAMAIFERKPKQFLLWVGVAMLFHLPAAIFLVAYPFTNKKIDFVYFLIVASMFAAVYFFRDQIVYRATQLYYVDEISFEAKEAVGFKVIFMVLIMMMALVLRPLRRHDTIYRQIFNIMLLAAVVQTFSVYDHVFTRLADYFYQFVVLFIPMMLESGADQAKQYPYHTYEIRYWSRRSLVLIQACVLVFSIWYYLKQVEGSAALLQRFHFFWEVDSPRTLDMVAEAWKTYGGS